MSLENELGFRKPIERPDHYAVLNIVLTGNLLAKEGDRLLRPFGLTDSQFNVMMLLKHQSTRGALSQTRLGDMLLVNRSNVTGLIDRMEQAGWVRRGDEPGDRRVKQVQLTPDGRRLLDRAEKAYLKRVEQIFADLGEAKVQQLVQALTEVRGSLRGSAPQS